MVLKLHAAHIVAAEYMEEVERGDQIDLGRNGKHGRHVLLTCFAAALPH